MQQPVDGKTFFNIRIAKAITWVANVGPQHGMPTLKNSQSNHLGRERRSLAWHANIKKQPKHVHSIGHCCDQSKFSSDHSEKLKKMLGNRQAWSYQQNSSEFGPNSQISENMLLSKYLRKNLQNFVQLAAPKEF